MPVAVEEELWDLPVHEAVAEGEHVLGGARPHQLPQPGVGEQVEVGLEDLVTPAADVEDQGSAGKGEALFIFSIHGIHVVDRHGRINGIIWSVSIENNFASKSTKCDWKGSKEI